MSATLLQRVHDHLNAGGLVSPYAVRYFRFTDLDITENTPFMLFRMAGSQGALTDFNVQYPDVQLVIVDNPAGVVAADTRARDIMQYVRSDFDDTDIIYIDPLSAVAGPFYFENGRPWFQLDFRVTVDDH